jgi:hypothetical protein
MASIRKEALVDAGPDAVWDALRDVGAIHTRLARGFVTDTTLEGDTRVVTFANGFVARERIVDLDDRTRRIAYGVVDGRPTHHSASIQVFDDGGKSRIVWIADLLPNDLAPAIGGMMEQGIQAMKRTLEASSRET